MMLGHTANVKKATSSKFQDSDSRMSRPTRAVSELPQQRPPPRLKAAAGQGGSESTGGVQRRPVAGGVRATAPRSPLHQEKKNPVGAAGSRVVELEAKLEKAHGQLMEMREQLAAAEKARKEARSALAEATKRFAAKKKDDVAVLAVQTAATEVFDVGENAKDQKSPTTLSAATDVLDAFVPIERENDKAEDTVCDDDKVSSAIADDGDDGKKAGSQEVDELRAKLMGKDREADVLRAKLAKDREVDELRAKLMTKEMEVYELRAKLMVRDTEVDELRETLLAKNTELDDLRASDDAELNRLTANLTAKDADIAALEADNADLTKAADEASEAVKAAAARAREMEYALRESAAREARLAELLRASEHAREAMEAEAQRSRVQNEQWRKAAMEAAVVIGGVEDRTAATGTPRVDRRCYSSAGAGECWTAKGAEEDGAGGKRKPGAMRVFSDLWKKKAHK